MALLSLEGTLKQDTSINGALLRISQALQSLATSLQEFREVKTMLGVESGTSDVSPTFVSTLKETVGRLVSDIEARPEIQQLVQLVQLVIQKSGSGAAKEGTATIAKQRASCAVETVASEAVCTSGMHSRVVRRAVLERPVGCRHFCALHAEVMDPTLWSALPEELVHLTLARLPIPKLLDIFTHPAWHSTISTSPNFRQVCHQSHRNLFGLVAQKMPGERLRILVHDIKLHEWKNHDLVNFNRGFDTAGNDWLAYMSHCKYASDKGLVCFVPETRMLTSSSIRIGNPVTDEWKTLPFLPRLPLPNCETIMVQLVVEEGYKVILVFGDERRKIYSPQCYSSKTGEWSSMDSGQVYGNCGSLMRNQVNDPRVFDCGTKTMYHLVTRASNGRNTRRQKVIKTSNMFYRLLDPSADVYPYLEGVYARRATMVRDRLFVLHECSSIPCDPTGFMVSEYAWDSNTSELRIVNSSVAEYLPLNCNLIFFGSGRCGFLLVDGDGDRQRQCVRVYESCANVWHVLPDVEECAKDQFLGPQLRPAFWCELRWDAVP